MEEVNEGRRKRVQKRKEMERGRQRLIEPQNTYTPVGKKRERTNASGAEDQVRGRREAEGI